MATDAPTAAAAELSGAELATRLEVLGRDLDRFPPGVRCPWPLAKMFNELLKRAKRSVPDDPMVRGIAALDESVGSDTEPAASTAAVGTVSALINQVVVALGAGAAHADRQL